MSNPNSTPASYCAAEALAHDRDRYMCALLAPQDKRAGIMALLALNIELSRIGELTSEEMIGLIRIAWWREAVQEIYDGKPVRQHAVVLALAEAIKAHSLPQIDLQTLIDARESDLGKTPFATLEDLETYAARTSGLLHGLWAKILGTDEASAESTGTAWGLVGTIRATHHLAHQNKIRLAVEGISKPEMVLRGEFTEELAATVRQVVERVESHVKGKSPVAILTRDYIGRIRKAGYNPFDPSVEKGRGMRALKLFLRG